ncbi:hypothetical protein AVEN_179561-1 [Araneus ventricosus]|uniref:Uncharacterized protein n=1 Tax=Araneus ventricosus TaxID=182803 RepID=A0A4Y2BBU3_ARAVE|nr:hypothetical protein AVEN_179561-1 [Araneus ventricosus]
MIVLIETNLPVMDDIAGLGSHRMMRSSCMSITCSKEEGGVVHWEIDTFPPPFFHPFDCSCPPQEKCLHLLQLGIAIMWNEFVMGTDSAYLST